MKVKFIYRNYRPIHSTFQSIMNSPPEGVAYAIDPVKKQPGFLFGLYRRYGSNPLLRFVIHRFQKFIFGQKADDDVDVLHVVDVILDPGVRSSKPYIADIGHVGALASHTGLNDEIRQDIRDYLLHENCKGIITRSEAAAASVHDIFDLTEKRAIREKTTIVYPAYTPSISKDEVWNQKNKLMDTQNINLLFIGNYVHGKGLGEAIDAFIQLRSRYAEGVRLTIIANDYEEVTKRYDATQLDGVTCHKANFRVQELVEDFYLKSHIFVMPSHHEILGMVFLEAFSTATPVIAINQYSTPEVVKEGYNGFLVKSEKIPYAKKNPLRKDFDPRNFYESEQVVVEQIIEKVQILMNDRTKLKEFSENALSTIFDSEQFSVIKRNEKLKKAYDEALN